MLALAKPSFLRMYWTIQGRGGQSLPDEEENVLICAQNFLATFADLRWRARSDARYPPFMQM